MSVAPRILTQSDARMSLSTHFVRHVQVRVSAQKQRVIVSQLHGRSGKAAAEMTKVADTNDRVHLMLTSLRLTLLTCLLLTLGAARAGADTINVAEFRWSCVDALECIGSDPTDQSIFSLTGLWDYAAIPAPSLTGATTFDGTLDVPWFEIASDGGFDQYVVGGLPLSAATTIFFDFLGETRALSAVLGAPGFAILSFEYQPPTTPPNPVPEPGSLALLGTGLGVLAWLRHRRLEISTRG